MFIGIANQRRSRRPASLRNRPPSQPSSTLSLFSSASSSANLLPCVSHSVSICCQPAQDSLSSKWSAGPGQHSLLGPGPSMGEWWRERYGAGQCGASHWSPVCSPDRLVCDLLELGRLLLLVAAVIYCGQTERGGRASRSALLARGSPPNPRR